MPNFFDQFDSQPAKVPKVGNFFDQFDVQKSPSVPQGFVENAADFGKSIPRGALSGFLGSLSNIGKSAALDAQVSGVPTANPDDIPSGQQVVEDLDKSGFLHRPQGRFGRIGEAVGEGLGNPTSYIGPGSLPLKIGGAILSSAGSETAGQATEGTRAEPFARIAGALAGGVAASKALGPSVERAAVPTVDELKTAVNNGYSAARNSGLELSPQGVAKFASEAQQDLTGPRYGFTGGPNGVAPKTIGILDDLQSAPDGASVAASNLDTLRKNLGHIAGETQFTAAGPKPTADAKAASVLAEKLKGYMENIPQDHVMAGNPEDYVRAIKQANGDWAAASRADTIGARLTKAENQASRARGVGFDDTIRTKLASILDNKKLQRGFTPEEIAQIQQIHDGTLPINVAKQLGKFGVKGALSLAIHTGAALGTGGASVPIAIGGTLARKLADTLSRRQAGRLDEMLRMRSPEYQARAALIPPRDNAPNIGALARSLLQAR